MPSYYMIIIIWFYLVLLLVHLGSLQPRLDCIASEDPGQQKHRREEAHGQCRDHRECRHRQGEEFRRMEGRNHKRRWDSSRDGELCARNDTTRADATCDEPRKLKCPPGYKPTGNKGCLSNWACPNGGWSIPELHRRHMMMLQRQRVCSSHWRLLPFASPGQSLACFGCWVFGPPPDTSGCRCSVWIHKPWHTWTNTTPGPWKRPKDGWSWLL